MGFIMMKKFESKEALAKYFGFVPESDLDFMRLDVAWDIYLEEYKGDGCMGCVSEVLTATKGSKKLTISSQGKADCRIMFRSESGRVVPVPVERKTNGGRIETKETTFTKAEKMFGKYVVYSLDICNKNTQYMRRYVPAVVVPKNLFIKKLFEFNAVKEMRHNGTVDGIGIQSSSKKFYEWLLDYPVVYDRNAVYTADDFEDLE